MTHRSLRSPSSGIRATTLMAALALAMAAVPCAEAARLTHSRVVSAQDAPLQVLVGLADLGAAERDSLQVRIADAASWQRAGLTPPVPLDTLSLRVEPGADPARRNLRLTSTVPARDPAVDILLDMSSSAGQRQLQVTVMQTRQGFPGLLAAPGVNAPGSGARGSAAPGAGANASANASANVLQGDTLFGIAESNAVAGASVYQMLVALWQANPQAFIQNNMNRLRAGATLTIPDAATVRAVDPADARRIFLEQAEAYARYRAGLAGAAARSTAVSATPARSGRAGSGEVAASGDPAPRDRLRLSAANAAQDDAQARGDAAVSQSLAARDAQGRVQQLQGNVDDLSAAAARLAPGANGTGAAGQGAAGQGGSGSGVGSGAGDANASRPGATARGSAGQASSAQGAGQGASAPETSVQGTAGGQGASGQGASSQGASGQNARGQAATVPAAAQPGVTAAGTPANGAGVAMGGARGADRADSGASDPTLGTAHGLLDADAQAGDEADRALGSGLPAWLSDNLLMVASFVLALIAFIIAWLLRRAGARRADDLDELDDLVDDDASTGRIDPRAIDQRLEGIDLDLDQPPGGDGGYGATRPPGADTRRP